MSKQSYDAGYEAGFGRGFDLVIHALKNMADMSAKDGRLDLSIVLKTAAESIESQKADAISSIMGK